MTLSSVRCTALIVLLLGASLTGSAHSQNADALKARLREADTLTALDVDGVKPWHLKLEVQLCDVAGEACGPGTIEEWWQSKNTYRIDYISPGFAGTEMHNSDGLFQTEGKGAAPRVLASLLEQAVHPLPGNLEQLDSQVEMQKHTFSNVALDCIMLDNLVPKNADSRFRLPAQIPLGLFPTYCFNAGSATLRLTAEVGSQMIVRNGSGKFQDRQIAMSSVVSEAGKVQGTSKVVLLRSGETFAPDLFQPAGELVAIRSDPAHIAGGIIAGLKLSGSSPAYPQSAKDAHIAGTVVLHAIIGRDGRIRNLRVLSTPDADLAIASLIAVKTWTYKPYLLNGQPTDVDTTITVHFTFG